MSLSGALTTAVSGLQTAQRQMQVTSGNVSNANVEGFTRKTAAPQTMVVGGQNSGVRLGEVTREIDQFLTGQVRRQETELGNLDAKSSVMSRVMELFGTLRNESTLANSLTELQGRLEELQTDPESMATRNGVVQAARETAQLFNRFNSEVLELRGQADADIEQAVSQTNTMLQEIRDLNDRIASAKAVGDPQGELEDERDRALKELSSMMDIRTFERATGETVVMSKQGQVLVDSLASELEFDITGGFTRGTEGNPVTFRNDGNEVTPEVGGRLGALVEVRDDILPNFLQDVDRLAAETRDRVNAAHNQGAGNPPAQDLVGSREIADTTATLDIAEELRVAVLDEDSGEITDTTTIGPGTVSIDDIRTAIDGLDDVTATVNDGEVFRIEADDGFRVALGNPDGQTVTGPGGGEFQSLSGFFGLNDFFQTPGVAQGGDDISAAQAMQVRSDILQDPKLVSAGKLSGTAVGERAVASGDNRVAQKLADAFEQRGDVAATANLDSRSTTLAGFGGDLLQFHAGEAERLERNSEFTAAVRDELKFRADSESGVNIDEELSNLLTFEQAHNASARVVSTVQRMFDTLDAMMR